MSARLGIRVAGTEGRTMNVRPTLGGDGIQLAILGKRGGIVEAFSVDLAQIPSLVMGIDLVSEYAWETFHAAPARERLPWEVADPYERARARADAERDATHCSAGHEMAPENSYQKRPGVKGCRRCRRERNTWWRKEHGLEPVR